MQKLLFSKQYTDKALVLFRPTYMDVPFIFLKFYDTYLIINLRTI